jgi:hypothetical protein
MLGLVSDMMPNLPPACACIGEMVDDDRNGITIVTM